MKVLQRLSSRKFLLSNLGVVLAAVAPFVFAEKVEPKHSLIAITVVVCVYMLSNAAITITEILKGNK